MIIIYMKLLLIDLTKNEDDMLSYELLYLKK